MAEVERIESAPTEQSANEGDAAETHVQRHESKRDAWKESGDEESGEDGQGKPQARSSFFGRVFGGGKRGEAEEDGEGEEAPSQRPSFFQSMFPRKPSSEEPSPEDVDQDGDRETFRRAQSSGGSQGGFRRNRSRPYTGDSRPKSAAQSIRQAVDQSLWVRVVRFVRGTFLGDKALDRAETPDDQEEFSLKTLQARVYRMQRMVMWTAMISLLSGVAVNEWCWLGYIPEPEEEVGFCTDNLYSDSSSCRANGFSWSEGLKNPLEEEDGGYCNDGFGNTLKSISLIIVALLLMMIFYMYECQAIELCMRNHLEYRKEFVNIPFWELGLLPSYLMETVICFIHTAPGITSLISVEARGRLSVYNMESVLVAMMFLRVYTVWRFYREWLFNRYTSKTFASRLNDVPMDSKLALKAILDDRPFHTIAFVFVLSMLVLAYLVRIAESPVNVQHLYFWNQLWLVVVTATSTGYGDLYPISHLGRFFCFIAMLIGIVLTAVLIASISSKMALNASEARLMNFLQSERWEKEIKTAAVRSLQSWWRRSLQDPKTLAALRHFRNQKRQYRKFLEATPHFSAFVDKMKEDNVRVVETLDKIEAHVQGGVPMMGGGGRSMAAGRGAASLLAGGQPMAQKAFEDMMVEMAQLKKSNQQLQQIIETGQFAAAAPVPMQAGGLGMRMGHNFKISKHQDPAIVASQAVEERVRRLENEIQNFDRGMAKCLGQVVRLLQGLY